MSCKSAQTTYPSSRPSFPRASLRRLQAMCQPVDLEATKVVAKRSKMRKHAIGEPGLIGHIGLGDPIPVFLSAVDHRPEFRARPGRSRF